MEKTDKKDRYIVPAVKQAIQILEYLAEMDSRQISLLQICKDLGIHKSKAYSILHTLQEFNFVKKLDNKGGYRLGPGLVPISKRFLDNLDARELAKPILEGLANEFKCASAFGIVDKDYVYVAEKAQAEHTFSIVASSVGQQFPIDMGSHGVAIASTLSEEDFQTFLETDFSRFMGEYVRFEREVFKEKVEFCRKHGYVYDIGHIRPGLNSVASPVVNSRNTALGYIIVFGLFAEEEVEKIGAKTVAGARLLSNQLG